MSVVLWSIIFDYGGCTCFDVTVFSFFFSPFHSAEKRKKKKNNNNEHASFLGEPSAHRCGGLTCVVHCAVRLLEGDKTVC